MANRPLSLAPRIPALRPPIEDAIRGWRQALIAPRRRPSGAELVLLAWRVLWAPFWLGSDVPAPRLPARDGRPPAAVGPAGEQVVRVLSGLTRRIWLLRALTLLTRGAWLGLAIGCVGLLVQLSGGPAFDAGILPPLTVVLVGLAAVLAALSRPTRPQVARMLDRSFGLHDRATTALGNLGLGVPTEGDRAPVVYLQVADAANAVAEARRHPALAMRLPVRELVLAIAGALLFASLTFLRGVGGDIPAVGAGTVPPFEPAAERIAAEEAAARAAQPPVPADGAPTTEEVQERAQRSNEAQRDLQTLGGALDDHATTRPAAEAIAEGDYEGAAAELREAAAAADQLSPAAREALAGDLDAAADQMSPGSPELAEASRAAADGLRQGGEAAEQGVGEVADAVEETGGEVASQEELAADMERAEAAEASGGQESGQPADGAPADQPPGEAAAGDPAAGDPAAGEAGETDPNAGEPGARGEPGEAGAPSDGADADPSQDGGQPGGDQPGQSQEPGQGEGEGQPAPGEGQPGGPGQEGAPGEAGAQPGEAGDAQPGEAGEGQPGDAQPGEGQPTDGGTAQQGGGAGTGEGQPNPEAGSGAPENSGESGGGVPAEERVTETTASGGEPPAEGEPGEVSGNLSLAGSDGEGVQTSGDNGSSSTGSGSGSTSRSGSASQGEVGEAGPDSNRVPADYRDVVEDYFSDPGDE